MSKEKLKQNGNSVGATIGRPHFEEMAKKEKGITLIALGITIIVMLILVGVSVTVALNGGLFTTAKEAAEGTASKRNEELKLSEGKVEINGEWYNSIDEYVNGNVEETLEAGLYKPDGTFVSWNELLSWQIKGYDVSFNEIDCYVLYENDGVLSTHSIYGASASASYLEGKLVVNDSITSIENAAFANCSKLTEIVLPDHVTEMGSYTECSSLEKINIPSGVSTVSFVNCSSLTSIEIPDNVTSVSFTGCRNLKTIVLSKNLKTISYAGFQNCSSLESIEIPNTVTSIGSWAFEGCSNLSTVIIPDGIINIEDYSFACGITSVTIPNSVKTIGEYAFSSKLTTINYNGTKVQWNAIALEDNWNYYSPEITVHCTDGDITIPAYSE